MSLINDYPHILIKFTTEENGEPRPKGEKWHLVQYLEPNVPRTLCGGEVFMPGDTASEYLEKPYLSSTFNCPECREIVKWFKAIKL